jgi:GntR family transcriptional regulator
MTSNDARRTAERARRASGGGELDTTEGAAPRYLQVARQLIAGITSGRYPVGSQLPTELELCEQLGISRFTAREAVRVLVSGGLVVRRQRSGTTVIATPDESRYSHALSSLRDLHQYAKNTTLRLVYIGHLAIGRREAREFGLTAGEEWVYATGIRLDPQKSRPFAVTRLYINPALRGIEARLRERKTAVYEVLEKEYGISIERVEQELQGIALDVDDAANLGVAPGRPGLRIIRRYFDADGRLVEVADNIHPSDRFSYKMQLTR